jgi:hypothetical protein
MERWGKAVQTHKEGVALRSKTVAVEGRTTARSGGGVLGTREEHRLRDDRER